MTTEEAIELGNNKFYEYLSDWECAVFQLFTDFLCIPFAVFHGSVEKALGRPVYTHEFGLNVEGMRLEVMKLTEPPSLVDIVNMLPQDKLIGMVKV